MDSSATTATFESALVAAVAAGLDPNEARHVFACSDYLAESFARYPPLFVGLDLSRVPSPEEHDAAFAALL